MFLFSRWLPGYKVLIPTAPTRSVSCTLNIYDNFIKKQFMSTRHFLILDSLTWDITIRHEEVDNINRYYTHIIYRFSQA